MDQRPPRANDKGMAARRSRIARSLPIPQALPDGRAARERLLPPPEAVLAQKAASGIAALPLGSGVFSCRRGVSSSRAAAGLCPVFYSVRTEVPAAQGLSSPQNRRGTMRHGFRYHRRGDAGRSSVAKAWSFVGPTRSSRRDSTRRARICSEGGTVVDISGLGNRIPCHKWAGGKCPPVESVCLLGKVHVLPPARCRRHPSTAAAENRASLP